MSIISGRLYLFSSTLPLHVHNAYTKNNDLYYEFDCHVSDHYWRRGKTRGPCRGLWDLIERSTAAKFVTDFGYCNRAKKVEGQTKVKQAPSNDPKCMASMTKCLHIIELKKIPDRFYDLLLVPKVKGHIAFWNHWYQCSAFSTMNSLFFSITHVIGL